MSIRQVLLALPFTLSAALQVSLIQAAPGGAERATAPAAGVSATQPDSRPAETRPGKPKSRAASIAALAARVGLGEGGVVADVGAGNGQDTWVFAGIVGPSGKVYAQEITDKLVESLEKEAGKKELPQVRAVRGRDDDPCLPPAAADLVYMRYVYHHFSKPREMLRGIWRALKPGGHLVVVDRHPGTLKDWTPRHERQEKHFWLAETTVAREAREEGFLFAGCAEDCCESDEPFVLIFQRPRGQDEPGGDPDAFEPLPVRRAARLLLPLSGTYERPVFIAMGEARALMRPLLRRASRGGQGVEIVLEEWASQKDERPPLPAGVSLPSVLTERGDPKLGDELIDVVFFLDSYNLLFHGPRLLAKLKERLRPDGCIYVLDRRAKRPLSRREASHHRQIDRATVKEEMAAAGFALWFEGPRPAPDRFLLVFGKRGPETIPAEDDAFFGGPKIANSPGQWLRQNRWRLRGFKTVDGRLVPLPGPARRRSVEGPIAGAEDLQIWRLPGANLELRFKKTDSGYLLVDCRSADTP